MKRLSLFRVFWLCAFLDGAVSAAEREINRTFPLQPGGTLVVDSYRGDLTIEASEAAEVRIGIHLDYDVDTEAEADRLWAGFQFQLRNEANTVTVTARNPAETGPRLSWQENKRVHLTYRITVPRHCHLNLNIANGKITVGRLAGRMAAKIEQGTIFFRHVDGSIEATSGTGDVVISHCTGDITARVGRGALRVGTIGGAGNLRTANGPIELMLAKGPLTAFAEVGDAVIGFPRVIAAGASITSSGGNVRVSIDPAANCEIEAAATWGKIESELMLAGAESGTGKRRLAGRLNQGGPILKLRANGGSVRIVRGEAAFE